MRLPSPRALAWLQGLPSLQRLAFAWPFQPELAFRAAGWPDPLLAAAWPEQSPQAERVQCRVSVSAGGSVRVLESGTATPRARATVRAEE